MNKLLTLDSSGYVSDPPLIVDILMRNFFVANYTQTVVHYGRIHSLPYLISKHSKNKYALSDDIKRSLEALLSAHFDAATVEVEITSMDNSPGLENIKITASVYKDDLVLDVGKLLSLVNDKISNVETI